MIALLCWISCLHRDSIYCPKPGKAGKGCRLAESRQKQGFSYLEFRFLFLSSCGSGKNKQRPRVYFLFCVKSRINVTEGELNTHFQVSSFFRVGESEN